jgi:hypothetical protein
MAALEYLNPGAHNDLRVQRATGAERHFAQVVPSEFGRIAARCPILFTKHAETGAFYAGALFGFSQGENLLASSAGELDGAVPYDWEREGFFIVGDDLAIDREHGRFQRPDGATLFDDEGQPSTALRKVQRALAALKVGLEESDAFVKALLELRLIESIDISLTFDDGQTVNLEGLYTIGRDGLAELDDAAVVALFRSGYLQLAQIMIESLNQVSLLARRRNDRIAGI